MARLVAAFGSSHSLMLTAELEDWLTRYTASDRKRTYYDLAGNPIKYDALLAKSGEAGALQVTPELVTQRYRQTQQDIARLRREIAESDLDALIIVGDDQRELFDFTNMPALAIYYGDTIRNGAASEVPAEKWQTRARMRRLEPNGPVDYPCHKALGLHFIESLSAHDFEVSALNGLVEGQYEGHALSFIHRFYLSGTKTPVVPILLNTYFPPNRPSARRCLALGRALAALVETFPEDLRIGIIASGGLSHFSCEEALDRRIIAALRKEDWDFLTSLDPARELMTGSSEILSWICVGGAAAAQGLRPDWVSYTPAYRTPALTGTGLCFATWR